jgi:predicted Zn-dependent peptidase
MPFHSHKLANGLQVIAETSPAARSVSLGFFVRTGSRDESPEVSGVTHFLEHMVFKGTPHRTALDVNRDFDRIGADYNAFTSEENTVFHAAVLPEYVPQAVDILADILRPSLRADDFDMEKKVIIEEIGMYEDQPMFSAYDHAKRVFFADHKLGNSILGSVQSITDLKRDQMHDYFRHRYVAPNILVAAAGRLDWDAFLGLVGEKCGGWEAGPIGRNCLRPAPGSGRFEVMTRDKLIQEHVILVAQGPSADDPLRHAADLLAMAVGDDSGSRLYWELVDPGLADSADCGFHEYEATGTFYTSFSGEAEEAEENLGRVLGVLRDAQRGGIRTEELEQARSKMLSRVVRGNERPKGRMQAIGMSWTYQHEYRSVDDDLKAYRDVTLADVRKVLDRFPVDKVTTLALGPLAKLAQP